MFNHTPCAQMHELPESHDFMYIYLYINIYYIYIYIYYINTFIFCFCELWALCVSKFHRSKISLIHMLSWKQFAFPVFTTIALFMHLGTWCAGGHIVFMLTYIYKKSHIYTYIFIYYILVIISDLRHRVLKFHRINMDVIYM